MSEPEEEVSQDRTQGSNSDPLPWTHILDGNDQKPPKTQSLKNNKGGYPPHISCKPEKLGLDRVIELMLTFAIGFFALAQWRTSTINNEATGKQVDKLIVASDRINDAADSFSLSASNINRGVVDAVSKLNLQAGEMTRLAQATEIANSNALEANRAWFHPAITVTNFEVGKVSQVVFVFNNTGRRPATTLAMRTNVSRYEKFPEHPSFPAGDSHQGEFWVPGSGPGNSQFLNKSPWTEDMIGGIDTATSITYAYSELIYRDIGTRKIYFIHDCVYYQPAHLSNPGGWEECSFYNDGN